MQISPAQRGLQTKMLKIAMAKEKKRRTCPKCHKTKDVNKHFGFRTAHDEDGYPVRSLVQSYCIPCRKPGKPKAKARNRG